MDMAKAKQKANDLLEQFGISDPYINPVLIARELGVQVKFATFSQEFSNVSGFYDVDTDTIFVNEEEYPLRQTFTVAHELGHRILHKDWAASNQYRVLLRNDDEPKDSYEKEADEFAGNLLVPRFLLDKYKQLSKQDLSKLFAVSVPVINIRLNKEYGIS
ncbi:MAG: ImmA/IrrE family metallo-endopeptidase [Kangiellaceae bacterium]|nr:ImmA/IrrE family metallo-endopeptidase [Kangiellaceae bacterium]